MLILIIAGAIIASLAGFVLTRPDTFRVERSRVIPAKPDRVFGLVNDFHQWTRWSPWEGLDPNLQRTYSGPEAGKGAVYAWSGNNKAGKGRMEILESVPGQLVRIGIEFEKPFEASNIVEFNLRPAGADTDVTWAMHGPNTAMGKAMSLMGGMERIVGKDFDKGLRALSQSIELNLERPSP